MSDDERFDIFDAEMNLIGTATRKEAHAQGLWHHTFHCWITSVVNGERCLLFQLRHPSKDTFPGLLDISCAGHLLAGEQVYEGVRELEEELGLKVPFEELTSCGIFVEDNVISAQLIDREFCHVFVYRCDQPLNTYHFQLEEITGLYWIKMRDLQNWISGEEEQIQASGIIVDESDHMTRRDERLVTRADFVPHPAEYYRMILNAAERL